MQNITPTVALAAGEELTALLNIYIDDIQKAYLKKDGPLTVPFSVKFKPGDNPDDLDVEVGLNFSPIKIKDSLSRIVNESQGELFKEKEKKEE